VAVSPAQASHRASGCGNPCDNPCGPSTTAPAFRTITCTEWVRENYQVKRTAYRVECRQETYDTCRTECVPEVRERTVCVTRRVPVVKEECRKVCHKVTVNEERTVQKTCYKYVQETCMKKECVRRGHWECQEVPVHGFGGLFGGGGGHGHHGNACNDPCANQCNNACPRTKTKKVWVNCPEYCERPVTVCKKVCYTECVKCVVPVCRTEWREEKVRVCTYQCVTENRVEKCTVYVQRQVPCKATRTVRVCVPYEECVTCCRMVPRTVTRQVPCAPVQACAPACTPTCTPTNDCCNSGHGRGKLFGGFGGGCGHKLRGNSDCCRTTSCCN